MSVVVRRVGALLAASSAVLHGAALGHSATPWIAILTVAVLIGCLYCAYELWTRDTIRAWVLVALMNLSMVGLHLPMAGSHHHGAGPGVGSAAASAPMQLATTVAIIEVLVATAVLLVRTRATDKLVDP